MLRRSELRDGGVPGLSPVQISAAAARIAATAPPGRIPGPINRFTAPLLRKLGSLAGNHRARIALSKFDGEVVEDRVAGVRVNRITPRVATAESPCGPGQESEKPYIVYLHGGAFLLGGAVDPIVLALTAKTGLPAVTVEYDLTPEQRYPVALDQVTAVWRSVTSTQSGPPLLAANSSGGNLALALLNRIVSDLPGGGDDLAHPAAVVLFSPWADLTPPDTNDSSRMINERRDPFIRWSGMLERAATLYAGAEPTFAPTVSPINGRYRGLLAPVLVTTGSLDLIEPDCRRLVRVLRREGVTATLDSAPGLWHAYQIEPELPEAAASLDRATNFISEALRGRHTRIGLVQPGQTS